MGDLINILFAEFFVMILGYALYLQMYENYPISFNGLLAIIIIGVYGIFLSK